MSTIGDISAKGRRYGNNIMPGDRPDFGVPKTVGDILNPQAGQTIGSVFGSIQRPEFAMPEAPQAPGKRETWRDVLGSALDAIALMGGQKGAYWDGVQQQQDQYREDLKDHQGLQQQVNMAKYKGEMGLYEKAMEAAKPDWAYEQDNAGNLHRYDKRTGQFDKNPVFVDPNPKMFMQDGQLVRVPNTYASAPTAPVGRLTPIEDGAPPPISANQAGDTLGAAYRSKSITQQEAATIRKSLGPNGQAAFEQWMRDNNIVIGGR